MNHRFISTPGRAVAIALAVAAGMVCSAAQAQTWEYKSYKKDGRSGQFDREKFNLGAITLEEKDGKAVFHMTAGAVDACLRGDIPAIVTKTETVTTIELQQPVAGCEPTRYVIRNDGSGGKREIKRGAAWVNDTFDHGLTPKK